MARYEGPAGRRNYALVTPKGEKSWCDIPPAELFDNFKKYGALLLHGFEGSNYENFVEISDRFCKKYISNVSSNRATVANDPRTQTVNLGDDAFPLHPEISHKPWRPDVCWFWCVSPPTEGGETTLCDGAELARRLPKDIFEAFKNKGLLYSMDGGIEWLHEYFGVTDVPVLREKLKASPFAGSFSVDENGAAREHWKTQGIYKPNFSDEPVFANFLLFARYKHGLKDVPLFGDGGAIPDEIVSRIKETADGITRAVEWRPKDLLMVDNSRFMHGRNKIKKTAERIIMTRFGYLRDNPAETAGVSRTGGQPAKKSDNPVIEPADLERISKLLESRSKK